MVIMDCANASILDTIAQESIAYEKSLNSLLRKQTGSYYTGMELALAMMRELVAGVDKTTLYKKTFLEPCVGTGNFVFAYLTVCSDLGYTKQQYAELVGNIYVCDINIEALNIYKKNLARLVDSLFGIQLDDLYFDTHIGSGLLFDVNSADVEYKPISEVFSENIIKNGFDIVVTNPPYKNLKAEKGQYNEESDFASDKNKYEVISKQATIFFKYSTTGILKIYKLFVEEITERYLSPQGVCSLLIPSSILSDKTCAKLRTRILETCEVKSIRLIEESSSHVLSSQALCAILYHKGTSTTEIQIDGSFSGDIQKGVIVSIQDILDETTGNAILVLSSNEYLIRKQMMQHPTIKELDYIMNLRGELDITLNRQAIIEEPTSYRFYRGRNIGYYAIIDGDNYEYVTEDFVNGTAKKKYILAPRLICQQVVNMAKKKRISFTLAPSNCVLGNSCNFVSVLPNEHGVDLYFLLGVLNSTLIEWFFKLTSSNNHINNYEIDNFPIPVHFAEKEQISALVKKYIETKQEDILTEIDALVYKAYGITKERGVEKVKTKATEQPESIFYSKDALIAAFVRDIQAMVPDATRDECISILDGKATVVELCFQKNPTVSKFDRIVLDCIEKKYRKLYSGEVLNHTTFKLSDLDLEMIRPVPQGGSWKDIPQETVQKSQRLVRITKTGGRTTLYGRIDYSKPSYTITTYFNRPGNGTYVHPIHQRVVSVREAARFQSFPDDYMFYGNKSDMLKQVGNAVPVLLAYNLGKAIKEKTGCSTSVDLFSGAGGMTYGFKLAGIDAVIANDIIENACISLKCNSPEIPVYCGDITDEGVKQHIIAEGIKHKADIICGGPPCQGFSLAGFRKEDDPRNQLFRHFVDIVSGVSPKVIVFENVEGILSYQNGETYRNIIELFSELGYNTEGRTLMAHHYGVPQKRKRVIILCTRKDLGVLPGDIYPQALTPSEDAQITARDTIYDLESVECSENAMYNSSYSSTILKFFKKEISASDYIDLIRDNRGVSPTNDEDFEDDTIEE